MKRVHWLGLLVLICGPVSAENPRDVLGPDESSETNTLNESMRVFFQGTCMDCHDGGTETRLNLSQLGDDLQQSSNFRTWLMIFDRIDRREMPPSDAHQPSEAARNTALKTLRTELTSANRRLHETSGRVATRRLSRQEYEYTLHDLLGIGGDVARHLPPENASGSFDVVASTQKTSSVHVQSLLTAADLALDEAIQLGPPPEMRPREIDYFNSPYIQMWVDRPVRRGGGTIFKTTEDVVTFRGANYVFRSDASGFRPPVDGRYRVTVKAAAHQPRSSITVSLKRQNDQQGESELFAAWDLTGSEFREVETVKYLRTDDVIYVSADELDPAPDGSIIYNSQPARDYKGEGVKIRRVEVEGPLETMWPPERTQRLFPGIEWKYRWGLSPNRRAYEPVFTRSPLEHAREIIEAFATRAFRREVSEDEVEHLVALAKPRLDDGENFIDAMRIPLRAILVSPELLFMTGPPGPLDDVALASRLSYFLWRSLPDEELTDVAKSNQLSVTGTLSEQVNRMLDDPRSERFLNDWIDQWLELDQIDATTPDAYLYPEYDDVLRRAMLAETRELFMHLVKENLSVTHLIDSDFTFLNRRLAEHYGIEGVEGERMRKVELDPTSVRGGLLSHASIAKITANGTVTTPVRRGNFVLTNLLGLPPNSPPPGIGSIEPDTRGATTIREVLAKHQSNPTCASCHRQIDPPGFALECFDPVGNHRTRYRNSKGVTREINVGLRFLHRDYDLGLPVDASGATASGFEFDDIRDYKKHLKRTSAKQVARHVVSLLLTFATGGEIEFVDRQEVERILAETEEEGYPLRRLIHQVATSQTFRNR